MDAQPSSAPYLLNGADAHWSRDSGLDPVCVMCKVPDADQGPTAAPGAHQTPAGRWEPLKSRDLPKSCLSRRWDLNSAGTLNPFSVTIVCVALLAGIECPNISPPTPVKDSKLTVPQWASSVRKTFEISCSISYGFSPGGIRLLIFVRIRNVASTQQERPNWRPTGDCAGGCF